MIKTENNVILAVVEHIIENGKVNMALIKNTVPGVRDYTHAAEIIHEIEKAGIIGPFNAYQPREVLTDNFGYAKKLLTQKTTQWTF